MRPDPRRTGLHRTARDAPREYGIPRGWRRPLTDLRRTRKRARGSRGRGRPRNVPRRRPPTSVRERAAVRGGVRRGGEPLDLPRILRRRDGRPDPPRVRETRPARRNPNRIHREPGLRRPPLRPTGLRVVRRHRAHRTAAPGPPELPHAERAATLPAEPTGIGPT